MNKIQQFRNYGMQVRKSLHEAKKAESYKPTHFATRPAIEAVVQDVPSDWEYSGKTTALFSSDGDPNEEGVAFVRIAMEGSQPYVFQTYTTLDDLEIIGNNPIFPIDRAKELFDFQEGDLCKLLFGE